jgi:DNA polymerase-3 subunit gamma/tau
MRDALSILDQAIASSTGRLTAESVRQLVGAAPSGILEDVMQAVARGSSEDVLRLADKLISDGQNPTHFARQLVRFLRNSTVAKVAGKHSPLLQISGDERARVARIAELFSEEDLARHLQIMLRTHGELGYKQEQRFHLELGLLKMAHAQRLLPIEQLLTEVSGGVSPTPRPAAKPSLVPESRSAASGTSSRVVSPFAADSARKSASKPELSAETSLSTPSRPAPVIMGSTAPSTSRESSPQPAPEPKMISEVPQQPATAQPAADFDSVRDAVLNALSGAGRRTLVSMFETAEWAVEGNEIVVKVVGSATMIDMSFDADAKRVSTAAASGAMGRAVKIKVLPGGTAQAAPARKSANNGGGRARAEDDPIVRRMQEKFGAEIRTIIDQRDKK